ncbi:unnamed protein product [Discula destructiva]
MTTNSFGGALPKLDFPSVQPMVQKTSRMGGVAASVRLLSIASAAGLAYLATIQVSKAKQRESPVPSSIFSPYDREQQPSPSRGADRIRLRRD